MKSFVFCILLSSSVIAGVANNSSISDRFLTLPHIKTPILVSAKVVRMRDDKTLYSFNEKKPLCPASTTKLVLSSYLLSEFGSDHRIETKFFYTGKREGGRVNGNLIVLGGGDPLLVTESLFDIAVKIKALGFKSFSGNLVIDTGLFDNSRRDLSRKSGTNVTSHAYDAGISAFGVNFNTVAINISPGSTTGANARVSFDPIKRAGVILNNKLITSEDRRARYVTTRRKLKGNARTSIVDVEGKIYKGSDLKTVYRSSAYPVLRSGELLVALFSLLGIKIEGEVIEGPLDEKRSKLIYTHKSKPLSEIVKSLNIYSNNYIADTLMKHIAANKGKRGSLDSGVELLSSYLESLLVKSEFTLKNGSGFTSENKLSANLLTKVLNQMYKDDEAFFDFVVSLPVSGKTGTLEERFISDKSPKSLVGLVRAKTGTLSKPVSVSSLAGYVKHKKHGLLSFAIIQNGKKGSKKQPSILDLQLSQELFLAKIMELK